MTAPINFPTISPPQIAPPRRGQLDGFAEFLTALQGQQEERAARREQLDMQRRALDSNLEGDKLSREKTKREIEVADLKLKASEIADRYAREATTTPGLDAAGISEIMGRMVSTEDKKLAPYLTAEFMQQVKGHQETLASVAERIKAQSGAKVATGTEAGAIAGANANNSVAVATAGSRISEAKTNAETAKINKDNAALERTMRTLQTQGFDAQRLSAALDYARASGLPWGVVAKQHGLPLIAGGLKPDFVFPDAAKSAAAAAADKTASQLRTANDAINALGDRGLSIAANASLSRGPIIAGMINASIPREQQEAVAAYAPFMAVVQSFQVKGAASDQDVARMQRAYVTLASDAPSVRAQKALVRTALADSFDADNPTEAMIDKFRALLKVYKIPESSPLVQPFLAIRGNLKKLDAVRKTGTDPVVANRFGTLPPAARPPQ